MDERSHLFLRELLETPSPSGYERPIQDVVRRWARPLADDVRTDRHGNVVAALLPQAEVGEPLRIMLAGHCDQIGLMVQHVDAEGFLYVQPIGGWDVQILHGQYLTIWAVGGPVQGVLSRKAPHLLTNEERNKVPQFHDLWLDIGAKNKEEVDGLIRAGDPVTISLGYRPLRNGLAASPAMDDKVGLWVVMEALRLLKDRDRHAAVYAVSTVQEEVGLRGAQVSAFGINPTVGLALDVTLAVDTPGISDYERVTKLGEGTAIKIMDSSAISDPRLVKFCRGLAGGRKIKYQIEILPRGGTDAGGIQRAGSGAPVITISIPTRYIHSVVESVHKDDLQASVDLVAAFIEEVHTFG